MIHVLAMIELQAGCRDQFLREFHQIVPTVRAESGCLEYGPAIDAETGLSQQERLGTDRVVVIEKWESVAALEAHLAAGHMVAYRERVKGLVARVQLLVLQPA